MSSLSTQAPTNPDLITLADMFKIIWDRKALFLLVILIGFITSSIIAYKLPKKSTYSIIYNLPKLIQVKPRKGTVKIGSKSYSCLDSSCNYLILSVIAKNNESIFAQKELNDLKLQLSKDIEIYTNGLKENNNSKILNLESEINLISSSIKKLHKVPVTSDESRLLSIYSLSNLNIALLEKKDELKNIKELLLPGKVVGSLQVTPVKFKKKLALLAGFILSLISSFCLVLFLNTLSTSDKKN